MQKERLLRANQLLENNIFVKAKELFDMVLLDEPFNEEALMGSFLAENNCSSLKMLCHSLTDFTNSQGYKLLRTTNLASIQKSLDDCIENSIYFRIEQGQKYLNSGNFNGAMSYFSSVLVLDNKNEEAHKGAFLSNQGINSLESLEKCNVNYTKDEYYKAFYEASCDETKKQLDDCISKALSYNIEMGYIKLKEKSFPFAKRFFDVALTFDNENEKSLIGMLLADRKATSLEDAYENEILLSKSLWYSLVMEVCSKDLTDKIQEKEAITKEKHRKTRKKAIIISTISTAFIAILTIITFIVVMARIRENEHIEHLNKTYGLVPVDGGYEITSLAKDSDVIENGVLKIPSYIGDKKIVSIGKRAFSNTTNLKTLFVPDTVTHIGFEAFYLCYSLSDVYLPKTLESIDSFAFYGCNISFASIPSHLFYHFESSTLENVEFLTQDGLSDIMFDKTHLTNIEFSGDITTITSSFFNGNELIEKIVLNENVKTIESYAFYNCSSLESVTIIGATSIGERAFAKCSNLTSVFISSTVTHMEERTFHTGGDMTIYCEADEETIKELWHPLWNCTGFVSDTEKYNTVYSSPRP